MFSDYKTIVNSGGNTPYRTNAKPPELPIPFKKRHPYLWGTILWFAGWGVLAAIAGLIYFLGWGPYHLGHWFSNVMSWDLVPINPSRSQDELNSTLTFRYWTVGLLLVIAVTVAPILAYIIPKKIGFRIFN